MSVSHIAFKWQADGAGQQTSFSSPLTPPYAPSRYTVVILESLL